MSGPSLPVRIGPWLAALATVVVASTVVAALLVMRSPGEQREVNLDLRRVRDLMQLDQAVDAHAVVQGRLPADLAALSRQPGSLLPTRDPVTAQPYGYEVLDAGAQRYRLCAVFDTDTAVTGDAALGPGDWTHGAGRHCFERVVAGRAAPARAAR